MYKYNPVDKKAIDAELSELIKNLLAQAVNYSIDSDKLFVPSNYLISPFNNTQRFIRDEYFLNAGTGKTLLMYDIAKTIQNEGKSPIVIHCGKLNAGHERLKKYR